MDGAGGAAGKERRSHSQEAEEAEVIEFTERAKEQVRAFLKDEPEGLTVRVALKNSSPLSPEYDISLIESWERSPDDVMVDQGGFEVIVDGGSAELLDGATVDWVDSLTGSGFKVDNPNLRPVGSEAPSGPIAERVSRVIEEQINPSIAAHGGRITLVDVRDAVVYLTMGGGCQGCGMASVTLSQGIRRLLTEAVPEIVDIQDVTNHAAGSNPYFQPAK